MGTVKQLLSYVLETGRIKNRCKHEIQHTKKWLQEAPG